MQIRYLRVKVRLIFSLFRLHKSQLNAPIGVWSTLKTRLQTQVKAVALTKFHSFIHSFICSGPYEFHLPPDPQFIDLSKNYIHLKLKIKRANGGNLRGFANDPVGPINLIGKTFFKQCKLYLGSKLIYDSGDAYGYRAWLETELNYEQAQKSSLLVAAGYDLDAPPQHIDNNQNTGWQNRSEDYDLSQTIELMAPLHMDLFFQEKFLLNQMDLRLQLQIYRHTQKLKPSQLFRLELHRQDEPFALLCYAAVHEQYKLTVQDIRWWVRKADLAKSICLAIETTLLQNTAKYPVRRVQIKVIQIAGGRRDTPVNSIFNGQIPRRLIVSLVDNDSYHGNWAKSPFNFKHFDASSISVTASGVTYPPVPIQMNYQTNNFAEPFVLFYEVSFFFFFFSFFF